MKKIAIFISHPVQYQVPIFKKIAAHPDINLTVFFFWDYGVKETYDPKFGQGVKWDIPLLEGYKHEFLKNISPKETSAHFFGEINPGLFSKIFKGKYDALIIFGWQTMSHWLAIFTAILTRTPFFLRGENSLSKEFKKNIFKRCIKQIIMRSLFKFASGLFFIHEENKRFYMHYGVPESKLYPVHYAIDNEKFILEAEKLIPLKNKLKLKLGINKEQKVILFSGKLVSGKRPFDLISAYEKLLEKAKENKTPKPALVFIGNGPIKGELEKYAKENKLDQIYFAGFKNQNEISESYAIGDVLVLPSEGETWGLVVNEAMCFKLPIIVSEAVDCGSNLVVHGKNGYVFPVSDIESLSKYINEILSNKKTSDEFGKESLNLISKWSFNQNVEDVVNAINHKNTEL